MVLLPAGQPVRDKMSRIAEHGGGFLSLFPVVFLIFQTVFSSTPWSTERYRLVLTQVPTHVSPPEPMNGGFYLPPDTALNGSRIVLFDPERTDDPVSNLTPHFATAVDPEISFDAEHLLFAAKKASSDPWQIWEMRIDGTEPRCLTENLGDCREPVYTGILNTLNAPEWDQILFVSNHHGTWNESGGGRSTALYTCKTDGTEVHRITYNLSSDFGPFVLGDGRILYTSWQRTGNRFPPVGILPLMTVFSDGTDVTPFFGNHQRPILRHQPREAADRSVYFIESDGTAWCGGGALARVSLRRSLHTREVLGNDALYHYPCPLSDGTLIVSSRKSEPAGDYGLFVFDASRQKRGELLLDTPEFHEIDAQILAPRTKPRGRSTVVNYEKDTAWFFCLDAYLSDRPGSENIKKGDIKRVRLIEGIPPDEKEDPIQPAGLDGPDGTPVFDRRRLTADFPIEKDGSISIQAPILTPLQFQTVDADGLSLQTCQTWLWLMPMERSGCIGCHEDWEMTPPNRFVDAAKKRPMNLSLPPEKRRTVDFRRDVMPIIKKNCLGSGCHQAEAASLDLSGGMEPVRLGYSKAIFNRAYVNLLTGKSATGEPYVVPGYSGKSLLAWKLIGRDPESASAAKPTPHPEPSKKDFDRLTLIEWIDLGARWTNLEDGENAP